MSPGPADESVGASSRGTEEPVPAKARAAPGPKSGVFRIGRGILALGLLLLATTPLFRFLDRPETGRFGAGIARSAAINLETSWWGLAIVVGTSVVLTIVVGTERLEAFLDHVGTRMRRIPLGLWALAMAVLAALLAVVVSHLVFRTLPSLVDGIASLVHARYLAEGRLSGPRLDPAAAWMIPNTVHTAQGWLSQYPPFHPLLLAGGIIVGVPWITGPLLTGACVGLTCLAAGRLLPDRPGTVRLGGIVLAVSPFMVILGAGYLSHVSAAALTALLLWTALRARDEGWGWALLSGAAVGGLVSSRPWTGLVLGLVLPLLLWSRKALVKNGKGWRWLSERLAAATLGGLPFAGMLLFHNRHFFGDPLRLGYEAAYGLSHRLGFHRDPWGNTYGALEALGFTSADLTNLGIYLLETPFSAVMLVALYLLVARRLPEGVGVLLAWALLPVAANALYWHHGFHLGPRMLYEAAPAWAFLTVLAAVELTAGGPSAPAAFESLTKRSGAGPETAEGESGRSLPFLQQTLLWALVLSGAAALVLAPARAVSYQWSPETLDRIQPPETPPGPPAIVFVHGTWSERLATRLQGAGMGLDSVETALRRNDICRLHRYTEARLGEEGGVDESGVPELDFRRLPGTPPSLDLMEVVPGYEIRMGRRERWTPECERELRADRRGVISLAPLLWQGDLPGIEGGAPLFVRDMGPEENRRVRQKYPDRNVFLYYSSRPGEAPVLRPYREGMDLLWDRAGGSEEFSSAVSKTPANLDGGQTALQTIRSRVR